MRGVEAETERKKMLEQEGHIILNLGQNQYGDLLDVCHLTIIEVKSSKHTRRKIRNSEKEQMANLLKLTPYLKVRYDIRFNGNTTPGHRVVWQSEYPDRVVKSFKLRAIMNPPDPSTPKINCKSQSNKNRKVKP